MNDFFLGYIQILFHLFFFNNAYMILYLSISYSVMKIEFENENIQNVEPSNRRFGIS